MEIIETEGSKVITLKGFKIGDKILLSDSERIGDFEKVDVVLPKSYLKYLPRIKQESPHL